MSRSLPFDSTELASLRTRTEFQAKYVKELEDEIRTLRTELEDFKDKIIDGEEHVTLVDELQDVLTKSRERILLGNDRPKVTTA